MLKKIIAGVCVIVLILSMGVSTFASETDRPTIENRVKREVSAKLLETAETMKQYITVSADGIMTFDEDSAVTVRGADVKSAPLDSSSGSDCLHRTLSVRVAFLSRLYYNYRR